MPLLLLGMRLAQAVRQYCCPAAPKKIKSCHQCVLLLRICSLLPSPLAEGECSPSALPPPTAGCLQSTIAFSSSDKLGMLAKALPLVRGYRCEGS